MLPFVLHNGKILCCGIKCIYYSEYLKKVKLYFCGEKLIICVGRPVPDLPDFRCLYKEKGNQHFHFFGTQKHESTSWLIGSKKGINYFAGLID